MQSPLARWQGKVALVTGASSGIGRAIAQEFGRLAMKVAVAGRDETRLAAVAAEVRSAGGEALVLAGDQARLETNAEFFRKIRSQWGGIDVLVNSAGVRGGTSLLETTLPEMQAAMNLNVFAALACMREAVADMHDKTDAAIINLSSTVGHRVLPGVPAIYAATKHALRLVTDGFRAELAAAKSPIKVSLISPGLVDTPWHQHPGGILAKHGRYPHEPLAADDIVEAVRYILSVPPHVQVCDILLRATAQPF
jgi:NADP-dependent 3-hydroxy acid dehydrogenase YdfG